MSDRCEGPLAALCSVPHTGSRLRVQVSSPATPLTNCQMCQLHFSISREAIVCHRSLLTDEWFGLCEFHQAQRLMLQA